jgi:hypothetical protein
MLPETALLYHAAAADRRAREKAAATLARKENRIRSLL